MDFRDLQATSIFGSEMMKPMLQRVYKAIIDFGFPPDNLTEKDFTSKDLIFQMGYPPVRIDVLTSIEALDFDTKL